MSLTDALKAAVASTDAGVRAQVESFLRQQEAANFPHYIHSLVVELGTPQRELEVRMLAGVTLKNMVAARSEGAQQALETRWKALPAANRNQVKTMLLQILPDPNKQVRSTAALAIGKIAAIEIPSGEWNDLISLLDANITKQNQNAGLRQSSLEALGYVCEEVPDFLEAHSNLVLTAIASGMSPTESSEDIKFAATTCLVNCIQFIKKNMAQDADRTAIMNMVLSVAKSSTQEETKVAAFQCLVLIAQNYYDWITPFMGNIFALTTAAIKAEDEPIAMQAVELWSTLCDVELEIMDEEAEEEEADPAQPPKPKPASRLKNLVATAAPHLTPFLLEALTKQAEDPESEDWNTCLAAGTCLGLCAQVVKDALVGHVLPFVQQNVTNPNWRLREAAILSFGCILDGPNREELAKVVNSAFELILGHMKDPHPLVKDTTAWTVGRICSLLPEVVGPTVLPKLMNVLVGGLSETPKVASNVCWAIHNLASAVEPDKLNTTSPLSPYFQQLMAGLITASKRPDVRKANLQVSIYEAVNVLVGTAAADVHDTITHLLPALMQQLQGTLTQQGVDKETLNEIQALLCGTLHAIVTKLAQPPILAQADNLMSLFLAVLAGKNSTVHEEALMAIGAVADKVEGGFEKYMPNVKVYVVNGLQNAQESYVCDVSVHVMSDISRAVGAKIAPWGDDVMGILLRHLTNQHVERTVKSHIIACIGDIALAVGGHFDRYLNYVIPMLKTASDISFKADADYEDLDYLQKLRESIIQAYSGILLGLKSDNKVGLFFTQAGLLESIVALFDAIASNVHDADEAVIRGAAGLIFDLVLAGGPQVKSMLLRQCVKDIVEAAKGTDMSPETQRNGKDAEKMLS